MASATLSPVLPVPSPPPNSAAPPLSFAEYMVLERKSDTKHHLHKGVRIPMAGATYEHNVLSSNLLTALYSALQGTDCRTFGSDLKVYVSPHVGYYPDLVVHCGSPLIAFGEALQNPFLIAEVLSESTRTFDRGAKFEQYQTIDSLQHVLFLEQNQCFVQHYARNEKNDWVLRGEYERLEQSIALVIGEKEIVLPVADIYQYVEFPDHENEAI